MLRFVMGAWFLVIASFSCAGQLADLYSSSALVLNQSSQIRQQAVADALAEVFVRVSGTREVLTHAAIQRALTDAESYLYEFEYSSTDETLTVDGVEYTAIRVLMKFSVKRVESVLKREQLPYWHTSRPDVLLWTAKADGQGGQQFIDDDAPEASAFMRTATERGVMLVNPVLDLEDRLALPVSRLWALDAATIGKASARYHTDAVLAGRFSPLDKGRWRGNFTLFYQAQEKSFVAYGENTQTIAMDVFEQVADYFAALFTSVINDQGGLKELVLAVNNVNDFAIYVGLLSHMENLPMVQKVSLMAVEANRMLMKLHYKGDQAVIFRTLAQDKRLKKFETEADASFFMAGNPAVIPPGTEANPLQFLWQLK